MSTYQAKLPHFTPLSKPEDYAASSRAKPLPSFIVARDEKGEIASLYGDMEWSRTSYASDGKPYAINFKYWDGEGITPAQKTLTDEMRWLMFLLIYMSPGTPLTNKTLHRYIVFLRITARFAEASGQSLIEAATDAYKFESRIGAAHAKTCSALLSLLHRLGPEITGYEIDTKKTLQALRKTINEYSGQLKQTIPIPTRIYSALLSRMVDEIGEVESNIDKITALLQDYATAPSSDQGGDARRLKRRKNHAGERAARSSYANLPSFSELLRKHGLEEFWSRKHLQPSGKQFSSFLTRIQHITSLTVQAFTGMRGEEADTLPYYCLEEQKRYGDDRMHYIVKGKVTKDGGDPRRVQWVTSRSGRAAILVAQKLAATVYAILGKKPPRKANAINDFHLFVRVTAVLITDTEPTPIEIDMSSNSVAREFLVVPIEDGDIDELNEIDQTRAWHQEEEFQIGRPWPLRRHQLRRSLALYAQKSGLVSLPALKRQLQHITEEMTLYYGKGSQFAKQFIGEDRIEKHFGVEWQETQPVSVGLSYIKNVLFGHDDKFGPQPLWIHLHGRGKNSAILVDRESTIKAIKKGQMAYKPTPIGGCSNTEACDKTPFSTLYAECLSSACQHMIGSVSKINRLIQIKQAQVDRLKVLDSESFELRVEEAELMALESGLAKGMAEIEKRKATK